LNFSALDQEDNSVLTAMRKGVAREVFCGGILAVTKGAEQRLLPVGTTRLDKHSNPVIGSTFFDLASLTKPLATTLLTLFCVDRGKLALTDVLSTFFSLPEQAVMRDVTIAHLLSHSAGLIDYRPLYKQHQPDSTGEQTKQDLLDQILTEPLAYRPGEKCWYSDFGFILLGRIVEEVMGEQLDALFQRHISEPLGLADTLFYLPLNEDIRGERKKYAATEDCPWRGRIVQAEVHDEHCYLMGGVAGHAGLFGTAGAVGELCRTLFAAWQKGRDLPFCSSRLLKEALTRVYPRQSWCLGFDTPTPGKSSSGRYFSPESAGHLGYTGTSFWIDPVRELIVVLLTNRVHPTRKNTKIRAFRPMIHDLVGEELQQHDKKRNP
jgi:CubicO group peptidase (beta-lactamase class C family)